MIRLICYMLGLNAGKRHVVLEGDGYTYTDTGSDGNIVITEVSN